MVVMVVIIVPHSSIPYQPKVSFSMAVVGWGVCVWLDRAAGQRGLMHQVLGFRGLGFRVRTRS